MVTVMKTHAPESRLKNTPKPTVKQGKNPSQLGQNGYSKSDLNPNVKALLWAQGQLEEAIAANYALTNLIQDNINIQYYEGEKNTHSDHWQKMTHGFQVLFDCTNLNLKHALAGLQAAIAGKPEGE
jgi:hypothetical protein